MNQRRYMSKKIFNPHDAKQDFPIFANVKPYDKELIYLDNAASAQKPNRVLEGISEFYTHHYANVHRGLHYLSNHATTDFENARKKVQSFVNARHDSEIIWTSGATDGLNLLADSLGSELVSGDEIILSIAEHHSNIVPWHFLRERKGCVIKWLNVDSNGDIDLSELDNLITERTKIISITHISNILGTINPIKEISAKAHAAGAYIVVDGSQAAVHLQIDVQDLDVDFYVATGHKIYAPTGIGFVYGKQSLLEKMRPYRGGGEMIDMVSCEHITYNTPPHRFEAGTPPIAQAIGLGYAIDYLNQFDMNDIIYHENDLIRYGHEQLNTITGMTLYGTSQHKAGVIAFNVDNLHPHDLSTYIDRGGIAIRAGHHCGQPLMKHLGVNSTARASFGLYNTRHDVDMLCEWIVKAQKFFGV